MLFKKTVKTDQHKPAPFPGERTVLEGCDAALRTEASAGSELVVLSGSAWKRVNKVNSRTAKSGELLAGLLEGLAVTGVRAAGFTDGSFLEDNSSFLARAASRRLPIVVHHLARSGGEEDARRALAERGVVLLNAANVQETADFTLIARHIADAAMCPVVCVQDTATTGFSQQTVAAPETALIKTFVGDPKDKVTSPTPEQEILFGNERPGLPAWLDLDRPLGVGVSRDTQLEYLSRAAGRVFFVDQIGALVDKAFERFAELTGRTYSRIEGYRLDDAEYVVVAEGAIVEPLKEVVDYLRSKSKLRAGLLKVNARWPFDGPGITKLLRGRKGLAVLGQATASASGSGSLFEAIQAAFVRAEENGKAGSGTPPYPSYEVFTRQSDRPVLYEVTFSEALATTAGELVAVFNRMQAGTLSRRHVFLGTTFKLPEVRLPKVERLQQRISKAYPDLEQQAVTASPADIELESGAGIFALIGSDEETVLQGGRCLSAAYGAAMGKSLRTCMTGVGGGSPECCHLTAFAGADSAIPSTAHSWDAAIVSTPEQWYSLDRLRSGGLLITGWNESILTHQQHLFARVVSALNERNVQAYFVNVSKAISTLSAPPELLPWVEQAVLIGAFAEKNSAIDTSQKESLRRAWLGELASRDLVEGRSIEVLERAFDYGAGQVAELPSARLADEMRKAPEPEAPWTAKSEKQVDESVFDLGRFWDSTGYLIESGRKDQLTAIPYLATDTMPARSSVFHDRAASRGRLVQWVPEKCTACAKCLMLSPDSAFPATIQDLGTLVETAFRLCKAGGESLLQLQRIQKHLVPEAHKLFARDATPTYTTLGALLQDAFEGLLQKLKPADQQRQALETEFAALQRVAASFPIARTETFFDKPEKEQKGSGLVFSLLVDPEAGEWDERSAELCTLGALEVVEQTQERVTTARDNLHFMRALPEVPVEKIRSFIRQEYPETLAYYLLNRRVHNAVLGGGKAGRESSGPRIAVRLVAGLVEATLRPRIDAFVKEIDELISRIEARIDEILHAAVQVKDHLLLEERLAELKTSSLDIETLAPVLKESGEGVVDKERLSRLVTTYRELKALKDAYVDAGHGDGRARMIAGLSDQKAFSWARSFPYNPFPFPWICNADRGSSGLVEGLFEGVMRQMTDGFAAVRKARLYADDAYKPDKHDAFFESFGWKDFSPEEKALCPPVLLFTTDTGLPLDQWVNRQLPVKVLVLSDVESLVDVSSSRDLALSAITLQNVFVLQGSIGMPEHLMAGLLAGLEYPGPALFHVYAPSPASGWEMTSASLERARSAVASRALPLFLFDPSREGGFFEKIDLSDNPDVDAVWCAGENEAAEVFTLADWAARESRLKEHFTPLQNGDGSSQGVPVHVYLDLDEKQRKGKLPVVVNPAAPTEFLAVSDEIVAWTAACRDRWRTLQAIPAHRPVIGTGEVGEKVESGVSEEALRYHALLTQKLLALSGFAPQTSSGSGITETSEKTQKAGV